MKATLAVFLLFVTGSANASCLLDRNDCAQLVGKRLWITVPASNPNTVEICDRPTLQAPCRETRAGNFLVTGIAPAENATASSFFVITLPNGTVGYVYTSSIIFLSTIDPVLAARKVREAAKIAREECDRRGQPAIGMTAEQAAATCWGSPVRAVRMTTAAGAQVNMVYSGGRLLRFKNGVLTAIVESAGR